MPFIQVTFPMRSHQVKQPIERELLWYDPERKQMFRGVGTELKFSQRLDPGLGRYRLLPEVVVKEGTVLVDKQDPEDMHGWWDDHQDAHDTSASLVIGSVTDTDALFDVPEDELDNFTDDLEANDFEYEVLG